MPAKIPVKHSLIFLLVGFVISTGIVFLLNFLLSGPKLGPHYDLVQKIKKPQTVSREILIIETDELVEGSDVFRVFMTLTEMGAANLVMTGRISPSSSPIMLTEAELKRRFMDEYNLVGANIRNLFEGIRMGTVSPVQAPVFVERVVELTELGRDRLLSAFVERDEDLIRSVAVFGNYLEVNTEPVSDWDGKIRRVKILDDEFEHPVFISLKNRFDVFQIENSNQGPVLWMRRDDRSADFKEILIPLDKKGNIISPGSRGFRRLDVSIFREYEEAEYSLFDTLATASELGVFSQVLPDNAGFETPPLFLGDSSPALREELLRSPTAENRIAWRTARSELINSLDEYFSKAAFLNIINEYENLIADTDPSDVSADILKLDELIEIRDRLSENISAMVNDYERFSALRRELDDALPLSYCIMGPEKNALNSALVANVLATGSHIKFASGRNTLLWSILALFIALVIIFLLRPFFLLFTGILLSFFSSAVFVIIFIFSSYWLDPFIAFSSCLSGTLIIFYCKCALLDKRARSFKAAYGAFVSKEYLQNLIARGTPGLNDVNVCYAAIIAIKETNLLGKEDRETTQDAGKVRSAFHSSVKKVIFNAGAVIVGFEGDTILACFGSPLEPQPSLAPCKVTDDGNSVTKSFNPADKAFALVKGLLELENNTWRFGIDAGECTFYWSSETGYSLNGRPAVRARLLVSKTSAFKVRALITEAIRKKMELEGIPLGSLYDKNDTFYAMQPASAH